MGTRHLYWILSGPSFAVRVLYRVQIIHVHITVKNKIGHNYSVIQLKVLTNEKRGGLSVVLFDRSPFKLFSLKFSNRLVQAPSCESHKTAPRTLFVSFANNNYFQIAVKRRSFMKKIRETCMPCGGFKYRYWFFADTPNIAWTVSVI